MTTENTFTDHGRDDAARARPGREEAMASCLAENALVVIKLGRVAKSLSDAKDISDEFTRGEVMLSIGCSVYDPTDPTSRVLVNVLALVAEFDVDLQLARTREGMAIATARGHLTDRKPKLTNTQQARLVALHQPRASTTIEIVELFGVARSPVYRTSHRPKTGWKTTAATSKVPTAGPGRKLATKPTPRKDGILRETTATPVPKGRRPIGAAGGTSSDYGAAGTEGGRSSTEDSGQYAEGDYGEAVVVKPRKF